MQTTTNFRFSYLSSLDTGSLQQIKLNENFALNDLMLNARLYSLTPFVNPPISPISGVFYLVGKNAIEAFSGNDAKLASFTQNGWRFTDLSDGMIFFLLENSQFYYAVNGGFERLISQSMYSSGGNTFIQVVPQSAASTGTSTSGGLSLNDIKPLQASITALQNATATLEANANLYILKTTYEQILPQINQNTNDISLLSSSFGEQVSQINKSIADLSAKEASDVNNLQNSISSVNQSLSDLNAKQTSDASVLQASIVATNKSVADLSSKQASDISILGVNITNLSKKEQEDINAVNAKIDSILQSVSSMQFGANSFEVGDFKTSAVQNDHKGFLLCNGRAVLRSAYADLFGVIGTSFGAGDGSATFNLPDFRGRVFGAIGQGAGLSSRVMGGVTGLETHTLTSAETPLKSHSHIEQFRFTVNGVYPSGKINTINDSVNCIAGSILTSAAPATFATLTDGVKTTTQNTANDAATPHNNMQPTLFAGNYFIYSGV